jgi:hypothetical protein
MIKKNILSIVLVACSLLIVSCGDGGKFKIEKGKVGHLTPKTTIQELTKIFEKDSIVKN